MKNIFKKNQIIITALAIMIVIAGYLSFTNRDAKNDAETLQTANENFDDLTALDDGMDVVTDTGTGTDTTGTDTTGTDTTGTDTTGTDTTGTDTTGTDTTGTDTNATDTGIADTTDETLDATDTNDETTPVEDAADELGNNDISDEDILATAQDVADNGEINLEEGTPGDAVLANAADAGYFISSKIDREQVRAKSREYYMDIISNNNVSEEDKDTATKAMLELIGISEKERSAEMLLEAKGFDGAVVSINDGEADVVVNAESLSNQQLAIIEDVVKRKTDIDAKHISIANVVVAD